MLDFLAIQVILPHRSYFASGLRYILHENKSCMDLSQLLAAAAVTRLLFLRMLGSCNPSIAGVNVLHIALKSSILSLKLILNTDTYLVSVAVRTNSASSALDCTPITIGILLLCL